jgi:hypothetical protein
MPQKPVSLKPYAQEVERGLPNERPRLNSAVMARAFYDYQGRRYSTLFTRDAENTFDFLGRPYRASGLVREVVDVLTEHLYCPGPQRTWDDAAGNDILERVYSDNHIDALMLRADQLSTLADVCAIQVDAADGTFEDRPITLQLWEAGEFTAWTDPNNSRKVHAVCTIDRYDETTRYRLWSAEVVETYLTKKGDGSAGGRVATLQSREPHRYGCIPFSFVHYEMPVQTFWTAGIMELLINTEIRVNDRFSRVDESINKHLNPLAVAQNADDVFNPTVEPMRFVRLNNAKMRPGSSGGYEDGPEPKLYFLQATIDVASAWDDVTKYINQVLEALRVPASAVRMEQDGMASGISLIVEQAPLLSRARKRRYPATVYETDLAKTTLTCIANHYGKPGLLLSATKGRLLAAWPKPTVPVPTKDTLDLEVAQVTSGYKSLLASLQDWYGITRDQALTLVEQMAKDQADIEAINPALRPSSGELGEDETEEEESPKDDDGAHGGDSLPSKAGQASSYTIDAGKDT